MISGDAITILHKNKKNEAKENAETLKDEIESMLNTT